MRGSALFLLLLLTGNAYAHRLDEYLQATLISVESGRMEAQIRLIPGIAVYPIVMAGIDTDGDGVISVSEQHAYAERVLRDLSFTMNRARLRPRLISASFPNTEDLQAGLGEIQLTIRADLPRNGPDRKLVFENRHQSRIGAYLVNCLVPTDPKIRIEAQKRNYMQSSYELDYVQSGVSAWWSGGTAWLAAMALLLSARLVYQKRRTGNP